MRLIIEREVTAGVVRIILEYVRAEVLKCIKATMGWGGCVGRTKIVKSQVFNL